MLRQKNEESPSSFITTWNSQLGIEFFDNKGHGFLKLFTQILKLILLPILSPRCFPILGGGKMMLREVSSWIKPGDFVYKTDIYSYYASINHSHFLHQLANLSLPQRFIAIVMGYCERSILSPGRTLHCKSGIPKGGSLSPLLGALYLYELDATMEKWMKRGDCFYARFQDDIILISRTRHLLRKMRLEMFGVLTRLQLGLRSEKTFMGRHREGYELLGYHITPQGLLPNIHAQAKALKIARRRYAQGGILSLQEHFKRWRTWVHAGLPSVDIHTVNTIIDSPKHQVMLDKGLETREIH